MEKLRQKEIRELVDKLSFFYSDNLDFLKLYVFYFNPKSGRIYISKVDIDTLNLPRVNLVGIYFGAYHGERFRLSIEGSKLINPKRNFVELKKETLSSYLSAENLFKDEVEAVNWEDNCPFLIVRFNEESLGCVSVRGNEILTYMPKSRKLDFNKVY